MSIKLYMDHHVPRAITIGLRLRNVDVLTAYEDGAHMLEDAALLDRALALGRALVTFDDDLLAEAAHRLHTGIAFSGVIYAHQQTISIGQAIRDLELIATAGSIEDVERQIIYLPL